VQHHRAHLASVLAERGAWEKQVAGVSFDGTGFGDDGAIWGGEIFTGSVKEGFVRYAHLRNAALAGGDAAARSPVQAAAGFLSQLDGLPDLTASPFHFGPRYRDALRLIDKGVRAFTTTSMGRLFDAAAALLGFTRDVTFEGQAAMWLEQIARASTSPAVEPYPFPTSEGELDFRPLLQSVISDRACGRDAGEIARAFQLGIAQGLCDCLRMICAEKQIDTIVLSGGVFQNELLLHDVKNILSSTALQTWTNHAVPPNDGGISLGQAALAAFGRFDQAAQDNSRVRNG
jgi:hydrogenase maturation protein HypF